LAVATFSTLTFVTVAYLVLLSGQVPCEGNKQGCVLVFAENALTLVLRIVSVRSARYGPGRQYLLRR
jgi:hypothetical protein